MKYIYVVEYNDYNTENITFTSEKKLKHWLRINGFKSIAVAGRYSNIQTAALFSKKSMIDVSVHPVLPKRYQTKPYTMR